MKYLVKDESLKSVMVNENFACQVLRVQSIGDTYQGTQTAPNPERNVKAKSNPLVKSSAGYDVLGRQALLKLNRTDTAPICQG
jgi:hypothetical protein